MLRHANSKVRATATVGKISIGFAAGNGCP
jgi:hypothetical protein